LGELTFASLEVGLEHSCGLTITGEAFCWGYNQGGALGNGTEVDRSTPVRVLGSLSFTSLSAGWSHTCGVTAEGVAYCWGFNLSGQLGNGTTGGTVTEPEPVMGGLSFTSVIAGGAHTCGLTAEGSAYCWGNNTEGELGDGTTTERLSPTAVAGGLSFTSLSASFGYTCGVTTEGDAYCWGFNASGRLGGDSPGATVQSSPILVAGSLSFTSVRVANAHTCGLTTGGDGGDAYCWGFNGSGSENGGNLGDGTTIDRSTPVPVVGELTFTAVEAGGDHSCGLTTVGDAYCWGNNESGQLGNASVIARTRPVKVVGQ
jgi:alpha-tubulin suppressor-like RCC1 family protein